ncbi:22731_t:CDS:2, partial [Dentiscutata erythropus]
EALTNTNKQPSTPTPTSFLHPSTLTSLPLQSSNLDPSPTLTSKKRLLKAKVESLNLNIEHDDEIIQTSNNNGVWSSNNNEEQFSNLNTFNDNDYNNIFNTLNNIFDGLNNSMNDIFNRQKVTNNSYYLNALNSIDPIVNSETL